MASKDRMPTLYEVLNRFSLPPVDLWSFYVFLNDHYGGSEYLEFWLEAARFKALCREYGKIKYARSSNRYSQASRNRSSGAAITPATHTGHGTWSPNSSVLFDMLHDDVLDSSFENFDEENDIAMQNRPPIHHESESHQNSQQNSQQNSSNQNSQQSHRNSHHNSSSHHSSSGSRNHGPTQSSDSVYSAAETFGSGLSQPPDQQPGYTSVPQRYSQGSVGRLSAFLDEFHQKRSSGGETTSKKPDDLGITGTYAPVKQTPMPMNLVSESKEFTIEKLQIGTAVTRKDIHEDAERIIATYLSPGSVRELILPTDATGWSMSAAIRQGASLPGGLDNPKIFDEAVSYVFTALEREAYPAFLYSRALANVQPLSSALRMAVGLLALFGAFWLGFVFILLDWTPKSHRCWVILPFGFGWYLIFSSLYRLDPVLGLFGFSENDSSLGLERISEPYIKKLIVKRATFIMTAIVAIAAAFCVIFIFVPGHRL